MKENSIFFSAAAKSGKYEYSNECTQIIALISKLEGISIEQCLNNFNYPMEVVIKRKVKLLEQSLNSINVDKYKNKYLKFNDIKTNLEAMALDNLYSYLKKRNLSILHFSIIIDNIYNKYNDNDVLCFRSTWKLIFVNQNETKERIRKVLNEIHLSNYDIEIKKIINDSILLEIFTSLGIDSIQGLINLDTNLLTLLFERNLDEIISLLETLKVSKKTRFLNLITEIESRLRKKEIYYDTLVKRNGAFSEVYTLEEIANQHGLTRERIRQIEKKAELIVLSYKTLILPYLNTFLKNILGDNKYITHTDLEKEFSTKQVGFMKIFAQLFEDDIQYSNNYKIFYEKGSLEHIIEDKINYLPILITSTMYDELNDLEKSIVKSNYSLRKNGKYIRVGFTDGSIYSSVVDELFPEGFIATEENMIKINEQLVNKYEMNEVNAHTLASSLARMDYCYIDKGTVINRNHAIILDNDLIEEIVSFITNSDDVVYYSTIYEHFKKQLSPIGVNNRYYLKGLIDRHLPESCKTKRDYISTGESFKSSYDMVLDVINNAEGVFDLDLLRNRFPGVMDYVFMNCIYYEPNILNHSYGRKFYNVNKLKISEEFISTSEKEIEYLLRTLKTDVITSDKIYSRMRIMHKDLLKDLTIIDNHFALFSLYNYIFKDKYNFKRPYIYIGDIDVTHDLIINNYVDTLPWFNLNKINSYTDKMNMRGLYSYLEFMISKSDTYVQINIDTCIKKESFNIDNSILDKIKYELDYYLNSFGNISSEKLNILNYLPKLKYAWNKYLLIGIIRSYLFKDYEIEYTDTMYNKTEFIIRRV